LTSIELSQLSKLVAKGDLPGSWHVTTLEVEIAQAASFTVVRILRILRILDHPLRAQSHPLRKRNTPPTRTRG
jgi:hypothetical protein